MTVDSPAQLLVAISVWLKWNYFRTSYFFLCDFCCLGIGAKKRGEIFFSALDLVLFAIPFSFASAFVMFSFFFPVQCPAHEVRFDSTGVILSPGFPENYPNLQMCSWLINVEKGYNITLHFELFQTEKEFDILEIFDGKSLVLELIIIFLNVFLYPDLFNSTLSAA